MRYQGNLIWIMMALRFKCSFFFFLLNNVEPELQLVLNSRADSAETW